MKMDLKVQLSSCVPYSNTETSGAQILASDLNAYIAVGIRTEHEATTAAEAREKLQKGMRILIREGSVSKDLIALEPLLTERTSLYMCLCTDDRNPLDMNEYGHLDYMIRELISHGTHPRAAYRAASLSGVEAFGLKDCGLITPGLRADIVALRDLKTCRVESVFCAGELIQGTTFADPRILLVIGRNTVSVPPLTEKDFSCSGPS